MPFSLVVAVRKYHWMSRNAVPGEAEYLGGVLGRGGSAQLWHGADHDDHHASETVRSVTRVQFSVVEFLIEYCMCGVYVPSG